MTTRRLHANLPAFMENVQILDDPYLNTLLTRLCIPSTGNRCLTISFDSLSRASKTCGNDYFPYQASKCKNPHGPPLSQAVLSSEIIDTQTSTVVVDIARAGILPGKVYYDLLNGILTLTLFVKTISSWHAQWMLRNTSSAPRSLEVKSVGASGSRTYLSRPNGRYRWQPRHSH